MTFIGELSSLLRKYEPNPSTVEYAQEVLDRYERPTKVKVVTSSGPCLHCGKPIDYSISKWHAKAGDRWLEKHRHDYLTNEPSLQGGCAGYVCDDCKGQLRTLRRERNSAWQQRRDQEEKARLAEIAARRAMPYAEYLKTEYWQEVRSEKLNRCRYRCELCGRGDKLHVHHKTYEHRGEELLYLWTLIALCEKCHGKFHDKLPEAAGKP